MQNFKLHFDLKTLYLFSVPSLNHYQEIQCKKCTINCSCLCIIIFHCSSHWTVESYQKDGKWEWRGIQHWLGVYLQSSFSQCCWILIVNIGHWGINSIKAHFQHGYSNIQDWAHHTVLNILYNAKAAVYDIFPQLNVCIDVPPNKSLDLQGFTLYLKKKYRIVKFVNNTFSGFFLWTLY